MKLTGIESNTVQRWPTNSNGIHRNPSFGIDNNQVSFSAASSQSNSKWMEGQWDAFKWYLRGPNKFVFSPESDVFIVAGRGEYFIIRMDGKAPKLPSVPENDLVESALKWTFQDVVFGGTHVYVAVVSSRSLRVDWADTSKRFR